MKRLVPARAAVIGGLVVTGPAGPANAQTRPNDCDARQRPERVRPCGVRDQNGGTRDLARPSGAGEGTAALTTVPGGTPMATVGPESPPVFVIFVIRLAANVDVGKGS